MNSVRPSRLRSVLSGMIYRMLPRLAVGMMLAAPLLTTGCSQEADSTTVLMQKVYLHEERGEFPEAIAAISELIGRDPENPMLYYDRGVFHEASGQTEQALADYAEAIQRSPGHPQALNNRAAIRARAGQLEEAVLDLNEAILHNPDDALAYRNRGEAYLGLEQPEAALADLNQAVELNSGDPVVYYLRGSLHLEQDHVPNALEDVTIAIYLDPELTSAVDLRAEVYKRLGMAAEPPQDAPEETVAAPPIEADVAEETPAESSDPEPDVLESGPRPLP